MLAYCFHCKDKKQLKDSRVTTIKTGKKALEGICPVCGMKMVAVVKERERVSVG